MKTRLKSTDPAQSGLKWPTEEPDWSTAHPYAIVAFLNAQRWLTQAARGEVPHGSAVAEPGVSDYTHEERPGRND